MSFLLSFDLLLSTSSLPRPRMLEFFSSHPFETDTALGETVNNDVTCVLLDDALLLPLPPISPTPPASTTTSSSSSASSSASIKDAAKSSSSVLSTSLLLLPFFTTTSLFFSFPTPLLRVFSFPFPFTLSSAFFSILSPFDAPSPSSSSSSSLLSLPDTSPRAIFSFLILSSCLL